VFNFAPIALGSKRFADGLTETNKELIDFTPELFGKPLLESLSGFLRRKSFGFDPFEPVRDSMYVGVYTNTMNLVEGDLEEEVSHFWAYSWKS
jgi:hypothetical protein